MFGSEDADGTESLEHGVVDHVIESLLGDLVGVTTDFAGGLETLLKNVFETFNLSLIHI